MDKYKRIKQKGKETRKRHKSQDCKVYYCKIDYSHLTKRKRDYFESLFREAKWLKNYYIASEDVYKESDKLQVVTVLNKYKQLEERALAHLSSQMKQGILNGIKDDIKGLSVKKNKGHKVGRLKFKSFVNSINLQQFDNTYKIQNNRFISLQGFKGRFRVRGLKQIPVNAEIANAKLVRKPSGYYIAITCFLPKQHHNISCKEIGFDFGIATHITDSDGQKDKWCFTESKRHKKLQRKVNRTYKPGTKSSKNRNYRKHLCRLEHEKLNNRKNDEINKFISKTKQYDLVGVQDESIAAWKSSRMKGWGRSIHYSIMGGMIAGIKKLPQTQIVDKWEPTSQECIKCGKKTKHSLDQRTFVCSHCGHSEDRDIHSAKLVLLKAKALQVAKGIRMDCTNTMPAQDMTSTYHLFTDDMQVVPMGSTHGIPCIEPGKQEAHPFRGG